MRSFEKQVAGMVVWSSDGHIVLAQKHREPKCNGPYPDKYVIPGGVRKKHETLEAAALRETRTETGLDSGYDGTLLANLYGIPSIGLGPGSIKQAHSENEFVEISQLVTSAKAFANLLVLWCGTV